MSTDFPFDVSFLGNLSMGTVLIVLVVLLILVILVLLWRWQRLKITPARPTVPGDGKASLPISVTLVNGFGLKRKPRINMDIEMRTTAGSVQNVVLPISRDQVEATLVSSREFGPVTVTAIAGKKAAKANVGFVCEDGTLEVTVSPETITATSEASASVRIRVRDRNGHYVAPLQDMVIRLAATLGKVDSSVKIPARSAEANVVITPGEKSGVAIITAVSDAFKGDGKVNFHGVAKRFCMHCGASMAMEASQCPKCGQTPPSGVDVKFCATCNGVIPDFARYCDKCGVRQP